MGATVVLDTESLRVEPGETGSCEVAVTNTGRLVDQFSLGLVGPDEGWVSVEPASLNLMPGATLPPPSGSRRRSPPR